MVFVGFKQILVPIDGPDLAEMALNYTEIIAEPGARIHLLSVAPRVRVQALQPPFEVPANAVSEEKNGSPSDTESETQTIARGESYIKSLNQRLVDKGYTVTEEVEFGPIIDTIVEIASAGFEVIVMTTHARVGLARLVVGSVAEGVLRRSPCPVLLI